ncbi:hypothetical protein [Aeromonas bivalvium]|uniref:hypothetical protein n=1 Tax=Aeromonas bivalvium TaxID=440079 RepID=UPI0005AB5861|nr:hypothetical protein [Aeromonas bivalvium]
MSSSEIHQIASELKARGISPTTAMIKARLSQPIPMAELLKGLSQWKQAQLKAPQAEPAQETQVQAPCAQSDSATPEADGPSLQSLSDRLARLEQKLDHLLALMTQPR